MTAKLLKSTAVFGALAASVAFANWHGNYWHSEGVTMSYLAMHASARTAALSGAGVATPVRASEVSRNPLATAAATAPEFGVNQIIFAENTADNYTSAYFVSPINKNLAWSAALDFLGYDGIEGRDENGFKTSDYGAYSWSLQGGFAFRDEHFLSSVTARFATQTIDDETGFAFLGDIGGAYRVNKYFSFGATLTNAGYATEFADERETAPMALQAGVTGFVPIVDRWALRLSVDTYRRANTDEHFLFGGEVLYAETLAFRMGYALRPDFDTESGLSCGLGLVFGMVVFDYGYAPRPALNGGNHHISLGLQF
ncbi:MAG: PorV/PorQ family protein [Fibrobacter sp.]|uniref:PorV/PorQ family protein n=1 Tax=Fibrobacter sp. TaxID=35828 RepID=UPI00388DE232|nr:PorV/PorQ family protein [Fibrobacter sp.]